MQKIVCFSSSDKESLINYNNTVRSTFKLRELTGMIPNNDTEFVSIWGSKGRNWSKIDNNDIALFYSRKHFISYGRVIGKLIDPYISNKLWGTMENRHLVFMTPNKSVNALRNLFWEEFGYKEKMYIIGTYIPKIELQQKLSTKHGSILNLLKYVLEVDTLQM